VTGSQIGTKDTVVSVSVLRRVRKIAKNFVMSVCQSVRPDGTHRLAPDGFLLNLIFEYFSKFVEKNSSFIKI
jgi:hypothetical protein